MAPPADIERLLAHADWLRRLAAHLVRGAMPLTASDAVQETWLAALRSPPAPDRPARPWLAEVLRNVVRKSVRGERARAARAEGLEAAPVPSPEALLATAEAQHLLGRLVIELGEPYRSAVLLRYHEGLEPSEIARSTGAPAGTVRWRLAEAHRRLRVALETRCAREGRDWRRALLPFTARSSAWKGALVVMGTKTKIGLVGGIVCLALSGAGIWYAAERRTSGDPGPSATSPAERKELLPAVADTTNGGGRPVGQRLGPPKLVTPMPAASGNAVPDGSMPREDLRVAIRAAMPSIKACYERLLERDPGASGRLVLQFTVRDRGGVGRISEATIVPPERDAGTGELVSPAAEQCILNALAEAPFPAPPGGEATVTYPFVFAARRRDAAP